MWSLFLCYASWHTIVHCFFITFGSSMQAFIFCLYSLSPSRILIFDLCGSCFYPRGKCNNSMCQSSKVWLYLKSHCMTFFSQDAFSRLHDSISLVHKFSVTHRLQKIKMTHILQRGKRTLDACNYSLSLSKPLQFS